MVESSFRSSHQSGGEVVLGIVAPVGTEVDFVERELSQRLEEHFKYTLQTVRLSELIKGFDGLCTKLDDSTQERRIDTYMTGGNELREKRADILALMAIAKIKEARGEQPKARTAYLVRTLKHPSEVETLREVFGRGFFLIGVSSSDENRKRVLKEEKRVADVEAMLKRDHAEEKTHGQQTRDAFNLADAFLALGNQIDVNKRQLWRLLDLLFGHPFTTPTGQEHSMFLAYAASLRSADMSRQVGAVIVTAEYEVLATGANDVPRAGGGQYWAPETQPEFRLPDGAGGGERTVLMKDCTDQRDYVWGYDSNKRRREEIVKDISSKLNLDVAEVREKLKDSLLSDLTEYGRAVHAEMDALLCCARLGVATKGAILFTTTFPCHNCAKHIIDAGIGRVFYVEPYPKSLAPVLHADAIVLGDAPDVSDDKVIFSPFRGVGPRRFLELFSLTVGGSRPVDRKVAFREWDRQTADLRMSLVPRSYLERENIALAELEKVLGPS